MALAPQVSRLYSGRGVFPRPRHRLLCRRLPSYRRPALAPDDRGPGLNPYAVLSWDYWNHRFSRDPHVLGSPLHIGDHTFEIIGVGPRDFTGTEKGTVTDIFLPVNLNILAIRDSVSWHLPS